MSTRPHLKRSATAMNEKTPQAKHAKRPESVPSVILAFDDNKGNFKQMNVKQLEEFETALRKAIGGSPRETEIMKGGDLLIKPKDAAQVKNLLDLNKKKIISRAILCDYPNSYYAAYKGQISNVPISFSDKDLLDAFSSQGVIQVERKKRMEKNNNKEELVPTDQVILTFNCSIPEKVKMIGISSTVSLYYDKPRKCYGKCWRIGHFAGKCRSPPTCKTCGNPKHGPSIPCRRRCINCRRDDHEADEYHKCPAYHEAQEAIYMSVDEGLTVMEALRFLREERKKKQEEESVPVNNHSNNRVSSTRTFSQTIASGMSIQPHQIVESNLIAEVASLKAKVLELSNTIPEIQSKTNDAVSKVEEAISKIDNLDTNFEEKLNHSLTSKFKDPSLTAILTKSITDSVMQALTSHLAQMNLPAAQTEEETTVIPETQTHPTIIGVDSLLSEGAHNSMDIEDFPSPTDLNYSPPSPVLDD